ncbi:hypothetical protein CO046_01390 [Candidatus Peregrinibacteria bacterium CG_4_9_14_0_2_um_filter_53_11]|nr:MAG: hypothetical protein CO046_01390 [Candidatus Peregrinibacteria bacterium CG_4_9_14_0_2_um_filter_53_11]
MRALLRFILFATLVTGLTFGASVLQAYRESGRIVPRTTLGPLNLGGLTREEARSLLKQEVEAYRTEPVTIAARGEVSTFTLEELGVVFDLDETVAQLPVASELNNGLLVVQSIGGSRIVPVFSLSEVGLLKLINEKFPTVPKTKNASLALEKGGLVIVPEENGVRPVVEEALAQLRGNISFLEKSALLISFNEEFATVIESDLQAHLSEIEEHLPEKLTLEHGEESWTVNFKQHPDWLSFKPATSPFALPGNSSQGVEVTGEADGAEEVEAEAKPLPLTMEWNPLFFGTFVQDELSPTVEVPAEDVVMRGSETEPVVIEGKGKDGRAVERDKLLTQVNVALAQGITSLEIPVSTVAARLDIDSRLQALGIKELYALGYTRYDGSPANRQHNIAVGVARYDGLLIKPGETFSFNDNLGPVDASTGYRRELVIKPEGTIPEFGGGLCQVSTTLYRAAIYGGLPMAERSPHSYAVSYYSQVGGHGLDATIYPPLKDLKFVNDTGNYLLIHSYVDGTSASFQLYGTKDGREVALEGPMIFNRQSAPAEPVLVYDPSLGSGKKKQVEKAHNGFSTLWYRTVVKDGEVRKEEIRSTYRAVPNKYLVGDEVAPAKNAADEVNPFE